MPRKRSTVRADDETAGKLEKSLNSTYQGLNALLNSLTQSGFKKAVNPYRQMQAVLVQQRRWCLNNHRNELDPLWSKISETAVKLYTIFDSFRTIMTGLQHLDSAEVEEKKSSTPKKNEPQLLSFTPEEREFRKFFNLLLNGTSISLVQISKLSVWPEKDRKRHIGVLLNSGLIKRHGWGRSLSYQLSSDACEKLTAQMLKLMRS